MKTLFILLLSTCCFAINPPTSWTAGMFRDSLTDSAVKSAPFLGTSASGKVISVSKPDSVRASHISDTSKVTHKADTSVVSAYATKSDSARASHIADTCKHEKDTIRAAGKADTSLDAGKFAGHSWPITVDSVRTAYKADTAIKANYSIRSDSARASHFSDSTKNSHKSDTSIVSAYATRADTSRASHFADSSKATHKADTAVKAHFADSSLACHKADTSKVAHFTDSTTNAHKSDTAIKAQRSVFSDSSTNSHKADTSIKAQRAVFADSSTNTHKADTAINCKYAIKADSSRASHQADTARDAGKFAGHAWPVDSVRAAYKADTALDAAKFAGHAWPPDSSVAARISDSSKRTDNRYAPAAHGVTVGTIPKAATSTTWGNSLLTDNGTNVTVGAPYTDISNKFSVHGSGYQRIAFASSDDAVYFALSRPTADYGNLIQWWLANTNINWSLGQNGSYYGGLPNFQLRCESGDLVFDALTTGQVALNGTAVSTYQLYVPSTKVNTSGTTIRADHTQTITTNSSVTSYALAFAAGSNITSGKTNDGLLIGLFGGAYHNSLGNYITNGGTIGARILYGNYPGSGSSAISTGIRLDGYQQSGTITTYKDIDILAPATGGTVTNDYCIYSAHDAPSYFAGNLVLNKLTAGGIVKAAAGTGLLSAAALTAAECSNAVSGTTNYVAKFTGANTVGNGSIVDNGITSSLNGDIQLAGTMRIGNGGTGYGTAQPVELVQTNDCGLAITGTGTTIGNECYVAGFLKDATATYKKIGATALQWTDNNTTNGYASWNCHSTYWSGGITNDDYGLTCWGKHGAAFFTTALSAGYAPGDKMLLINGHQYNSESINGKDTIFATRNTSAGTSAYSRWSMGNNGSYNAFTIDGYGHSHATTPDLVQICNQFNAPLMLGAYGNQGTITIGNGNVGIGTTSPYTNLTLVNTNEGISFEAGSDPASRRWWLTSDAVTPGDFSISTEPTKQGSTEPANYRFYIDPSGNIGLNNDAPASAPVSNAFNVDIIGSLTIRNSGTFITQFYKARYKDDLEMTCSSGDIYITPSTKTQANGEFIVNNGNLLVLNGYITQGVGSNVSSASTITPTGQIFTVTGSTNINTINPPYTGFTGSIFIIVDAAATWSTTTSGNITNIVNNSGGFYQNYCIPFFFDGMKWHPVS